MPGSSRRIAPSSVSARARRSHSASETGPSVAREPSASTTSSSSTWSIVVPWRIDALPEELLPIMPPSVARLEVEVSGPKPSPWDRAAALSASCTAPGSTRTRRFATSISPIASRWREWSSTIPRPPAAWPARLVPPPRETTGTPCSAAIATAAATSPALRGNATSSGSTAYMLASAAYRWRV